MIDQPYSCQRCHARKIKCVGGNPCSSCISAGCEMQCTYVERDRKVRVDESYLEQLIRDSDELGLHKLGASNNVITGVQAPVGLQTTTSTPDPPKNADMRNSSMKYKAWFLPHQEPDLPIFLSDVTCTAFATRLCQRLAGDEKPAAHIPRMQCAHEPILNSFTHTGMPWPNLPRARLLVNTALGHSNPPFHLTLRKRTLDHLDTIYQNTAFNNPVLVCKYSALFALGEICSVSGGGTSGGIIPGIDYYTKAISLIPRLPERPSMAHIEALVILSLYSQFLNRWNFAYTTIGTALRLALAAGLNHNIPPEQCPDPIARENRVRLWWTIYTFDRFWSLKLGLPLQINASDIHVDLPSNLGINGYEDEFIDASYQVALIDLAKISGKIMQNIYNWRTFDQSFVQREQRTLTELKEWLQRLPSQFQLQTRSQNPKFTVFIHLQFNYCVILAIRPILLSLIDHTRENPGREILPSPAVIALSQACIHSARHTMSLCADEWTKGSLPVYGYAFAQYIFTSSLALIVATFLPGGSSDDLEHVNTSLEMLSCLVANGSMVAHDLLIHLQRVQTCLQQSNQPSQFSSGSPHQTPPAQCRMSSPHLPSDRPQQPLLTAHTFPDQLPISAVTELQPPAQSDTTPYQPVMQDFLAQSVMGIDFLDSSDFSEFLTDSWLNAPLWDGNYP
ncbi:fungal-specific transcription factor domain-containing protein [Aspergillus pseudodeflectus]|uniref:Fungal-specific transcription factor domain-containing protein n=1 Tax=Aspergillus pseudodeflectus TaxID=176178 RepID=A0ABR4JPK5_9EURO